MNYKDRYTLTSDIRELNKMKNALAIKRVNIIAEMQKVTTEIKMIEEKIEALSRRSHAA